jgi:hypothetical protein
MLVFPAPATSHSAKEYAPASGTCQSHPNAPGRLSFPLSSRNLTVGPLLHRAEWPVKAKAKVRGRAVASCAEARAARRRPPSAHDPPTVLDSNDQKAPEQENPGAASRAELRGNCQMLGSRPTSRTARLDQAPSSLGHGLREHKRESARENTGYGTGMTGRPRVGVRG